MSVSFTFSAVSLFYSILLTIMFFSKERLVSIENKIYSWAIISNLIGVVLAILSYFFIGNMDKYPSTNLFISKLYLVYLLTYISILTLYILTISYKKNAKISKEKSYKKNFYRLSFAYLLFLLLAFILPLNFHNENNVIYSYGPCANLVYIVSLLYITIWLINMFRNYKDLKSKKYIPLFFFILIGSVVTILQRLNPGLLLMTAMETFITFLMYFTIENPDIKMIEELNSAKSQAEKYVNDKTTFLFNLSQKIKEPIATLEILNKEIEQTDNTEEIKDIASRMNLSYQKLNYLVNDSLDITIDPRYKVIETQYNIKNILNEILIKEKKEVINSEMEFKTNIDKALPEILFGDSIKLKQILLSLFDHINKNSDKGTLIFSVLSEKKDDICTLNITMSHTNLKLKLDDINVAFEKSDEDENSNYLEDKILNFRGIKDFVNLLGGTILVHTNNSNNKIIKIVLEQRISMIKSNQTLEILEDFQKEKKEKAKILIVADDDKYITSITKLIDSSLYNVIVARGGQECLEKIRKNEKVDLILLDDNLKKLDSLTTFERLKRIVGFDTPVVIMSESYDEKSLKKYAILGLSSTLLKPIKLKELNEILKTYVKTDDNI